MKKIIEGLITIPIFTLCCSSTPLNQKEVELTGVIIQEETDEYIKLRNFYTCNTVGEGRFSIMNTYFPTTKAEESCGMYNYYSFDGKINERTPISNKILKSDLDINNKLKGYLYINFKESQKIELRYRDTGYSQIYFSEANNNKPLTNGYIKESKSPFNDEYNYVHEDKIVFYNFEDLVVNQTYNYFAISRFRLNYTNGSDDVYKGKIRLAFEDKYSDFEDFPLVEDSMYRYIDLKLNTLDSGLQYLTFENPIYFDIATHKTSPFYKAGYTATNYLYFPKGKAKELKYINAYIEFDVNGYTNYKCTGKFQITYEKEVIGKCEDSEYCIYISDDPGTNNKENIIEVKS